MHPLKKAFFVALGCISLALGTIGIALPILPTVPFYLLTAFCFANSSERLHTWFTHTTVYKKYIGSYFRRRGMTRKAKALLIGTVTAIMLPGFILMDKVPVGRAIMAIVWAGHIVYFGFKVQADHHPAGSGRRHGTGTGRVSNRTAKNEAAAYFSTQRLRSGFIFFLG